MENNTPITAEKPLTEATADLIVKIEKDNARGRNLSLAALILLVLVVALGVVGIYKQNSIAQDSKEHIDCIIKDLATPRPADKGQKYIDYKSVLSKDCKIKFSE